MSSQHSPDPSLALDALSLHPTIRPSIGNTSNYAFQSPPYQTSRGIICTELAMHHTSNEPRVMEMCFKTDQVPATALRAAKKAVRENLTVLTDVLRAEDEKQMYQPLADLIMIISGAVGKKDGPLNRVTVASSTRGLRDNLPVHIKRSPDLVTLDVEPAPDVAGKWAHVAATWELKTDAHDGPSDDTDPVAKPKAIYGQVGDGCRIRMACRPHQNFTLAVIVAEKHFWGTLWDRDGVTASSAFSLSKDLDSEGMDMFIRVAIQLNRRLTDVELGLDSTIIYKTPKGAHFSDSVAKATVNFDGQTWTLEERMFQSVALIGRGTSVYLVRNEQGVQRVMKSTWRAATRPTEIDQYDKIVDALGEHPWPRGLGRIHSGKDVELGTRVIGGHNLRTVRNQPTVVISTDAIRAGLKSRSAISHPGETGNYLVMYRMMLADLGRPFWSYDEDLEIVLAMRDCIKGLQRLHSLGFVHRDVSAGNFLLSARQGSFVYDPESERQYGFVIDYEFLSPKGQAPAFGTQVSGTAQFMSVEFLNYVQQYIEAHGEPVPVVAPDAHHDLEAAIHVFVYAVTRRELDAAVAALAAKPADEELVKREKALRTFADATFGVATYNELILARNAIRKRFPAAALKHTHLVPLLQRFLTRLFAQNLPPPSDNAYDSEDEDDPFFQQLHAGPKLISAEYIITQLDKTVDQIRVRARAPAEHE